MKLSLVKPHPRSASIRQRALTLLELLIVISILAILTTIATRSLVSIGEQTQFEANDTLAKDFRRALIGTPGAIQSDGTPAASGFIADMGRPPRAELESPFVVGENEASAFPTDSAYTLRELVEQRAAPTFRFYPTDSTTVTRTTHTFGGNFANLPLYDSTNRIATGWKGPYITGGSDSVLKDAWSKPLAAYSTVAERNLVDMWTASYDANLNDPPLLNPLTGVSVVGYHPLGNGTGAFPLDVLGVVIRPGPPSVVAAGGSLSLAAYSNVFSAGVVFTNEFVAQLVCTLNFNVNTNEFAITNPIPNVITNTSANYHFLAGVLMYGPNPNFNSALTPDDATSKPVGVAWVGSATSINASGVLVGLNPGISAPVPTAVSLAFTDYPCQFSTGAGATYPLVHGARVVKPFLLAQKKDSALAAISTVANVYWGPARNLTLRPGYNSVQLTVP